MTIQAQASSKQRVVVVCSCYALPPDVSCVLMGQDRDRTIQRRARGFTDSARTVVRCSCPMGCTSSTDAEMSGSIHPTRLSPHHAVLPDSPITPFESRAASPRRFPTNDEAPTHRLPPSRIQRHQRQLSRGSSSDKGVSASTAAHATRRRQYPHVDAQGVVHHNMESLAKAHFS